MKRIFTPFTRIIFPEVCIACGSSFQKSDRFICYWCKNERFEPAVKEKKRVLPENIRFLYSMWKFDKGGYLQDMLHNLKYNYLKGVGVELGRILGRAFLEAASKEYAYADLNRALIVPVPLHTSKKRKRGYNQSMALGEGFAKITGWDLIPPHAVVRIRKTKTQTGLNSTERAKNLDGAFLVDRSGVLEGRFPVIIDDVFTTGATTFELAKILYLENGLRSGIVTVAGA